MKRHKITARENWRIKVEQLGFHYHTLDGAIYWDESAYYEFNYPQVEKIEQASTELYNLCIKAVDYVIRNEFYDLFHIPVEYHSFIKKSWQQQAPSLYGRFDLVWDGSASTHPKMLEFNGDTPTSLFEAAVIQWFWLKDYQSQFDQFNSIHDKLITEWRKVKDIILDRPFHFACLQHFPEDLINVLYLQDCASQCGIDTHLLGVKDIGQTENAFIDLNERKIENIFKLYPWEWMIHEEYGPLLLQTDTRWYEPPWKMLLSNKAILPVLWYLFPNHPNLLESHFDGPGSMTSYAAKPLLSREGSNVTLVENGNVISQTGGEYGDEGFIYQQLHKLPFFEGYYPVIGSWIIGGQAAGIGIRETSSLVTDNFSRFVPHAIPR